jgi:hypothetical protein
MKRGISISIFASILVLTIGFLISSCSNDKKVVDDIYKDQNNDQNNDKSDNITDKEVAKNTEEDKLKEEAEGSIDKQTIENTQEPKEEFKEEAVTDEKKLNELKEFIDKVHYNYLFVPNLETGEITESEMQLFAIAHIYQYEHQELKFDAEKFLLYIPKKNVEEVINRFFDYIFVNHKKPAEESIQYKNGNYIIPAIDLALDDIVNTKKVTRISKYEYKYIYDKVDQYENVIDTFEVVLEQKKNKCIIKSFKKYVDPAKEVNEDQKKDVQ